MDGLIVLGFIIAAVVALDFSALRWGADSRIGFEDRRQPTNFRSI